MGKKLTIKDLRNMDGELVWVVGEGEYSISFPGEWVVVETINEKLKNSLNSYWSFNDIERKLCSVYRFDPEAYRPISKADFLSIFD